MRSFSKSLPQDAASYSSPVQTGDGSSDLRRNPPVSSGAVHITTRWQQDAAEFFWCHEHPLPLFPAPWRTSSSRKGLKITRLWIASYMIFQAPRPGVHSSKPTRRGLRRCDRRSEPSSPCQSAYQRYSGTTRGHREHILRSVKCARGHGHRTLSFFLNWPAPCSDADVPEAQDTVNQTSFDPARGCIGFRRDFPTCERVTPHLAHGLRELPSVDWVCMICRKPL